MAKQKSSNKNGKLRSQKAKKGAKRPRNTKNGIKRRMAGTKSVDARQKILQKKRRNVVDARDIIARKSKRTDARAKIDKIRTDRPGGPTIKVIGSNIVQKIDSNGKISLLTNKAKLKSDMNLTIQKQLGLIPSLRKNSPPKRSAAVNSVLPIRKREYEDYPSFSESRQRLFDPALYRWVRPGVRSSVSDPQLVDLQTTRRAMREALREELSCGWPTYASHIPARPLRLAPAAPIVPPHRSSQYIDLDEPSPQIVIDEDEDMPLVATPRSTSNIRSRLDGAVQKVGPESHGIFSSGTAQKKVMIVPEGHRIVVSNLQPTVTQDDIKELFEDIGQLISAKLVRAGVAEVIYKNLKDAQKAVDTYHNRQLDGQPMKCLLVNKRPLYQPTAMPISTHLTNRTPRKVVATVPPCPPNNKLVPDVSTIHKVLFHKNK